MGYTRNSSSNAVALKTREHQRAVVWSSETVSFFRGSQANEWIVCVFLLFVFFSHVCLWLYFNMYVVRWPSLLMTEFLIIVLYFLAWNKSGRHSRRLRLRQSSPQLDRSGIWYWLKFQLDKLPKVILRPVHVVIDIDSFMAFGSERSATLGILLCPNISFSSATIPIYRHLYFSYSTKWTPIGFQHSSKICHSFGV